MKDKKIRAFEGQVYEKLKMIIKMKMKVCYSLATSREASE